MPAEKNGIGQLAPACFAQIREKITPRLPQPPLFFSVLGRLIHTGNGFNGFTDGLV